MTPSSGSQVHPMSSAADLMIMGAHRMAQSFVSAAATMLRPAGLLPSHRLLRRLQRQLPLVLQTRSDPPARGRDRQTAAAVGSPAAGSAPSVSVVIPAYQGSRTIRDCLGALARQSGLGSLEVIVVESSGDGAADIVEQQFPWVRVVREPSRLSAGAARNRGADLASGEFILFLDQDCVAPADWASRIVAHLRGSGVDAIGGSISIADPRNLSGAATFFLEFLHHFPRSSSLCLDHPFLIGCNIGIRAELMRRVQFPDLTLSEDVLFTERLRRSLYTVGYDPSITVCHFNRRGWHEFFAYARKMGVASADYNAALQRRWVKPILRWPLLVYPASLPLPLVIGFRLLRSRSISFLVFLMVAPACLLGNLTWAQAFRRRTLERRRLSPP